IEAAGNKDEYLKIIDFIANRVYPQQDKKKLHPKLGKGETEAIILYLELNADLLIIDDKKARTVSESYNIKCIGTLGLLTLAKQRGHIDELRQYFDLLLRNESYFSIQLLNRILQLNEEEELEQAREG
ncbi:MAG: DUF3368 domain-containing protein, partial [bacterium]|nr:DUF3368 domain-containing protein [bacterium]